MDEKKKKPSSTWKLILVVISILVIIFGIFTGIAYLARLVDSRYATTPTATTDTATTNSKTTSKDIVGSWDTGCLVPDPNSPWAERHTFVINANGTAEHKRYSGDACPVTTLDQDDKINYTIPQNGQINLAFTTGVAAGHTIYDIYNVSGDTLLFGHGFCNCSTGKDIFGQSEAARFATLNNFLIYKKQ